MNLWFLSNWAFHQNKRTNCACYWHVFCTLFDCEIHHGIVSRLTMIMVTLLYWAVKQAVGFILFQVKPFRFGWCSIDIPPIDFAFLAHFGFLNAFGDLLESWTIIKEPMTSKGTAYMFTFAKACPYLPALITIVQNSWQWHASKLAQASLSAPYCLPHLQTVL